MQKKWWSPASALLEMKAVTSAISEEFSRLVDRKKTFYLWLRQLNLFSLFWGFKINRVYQTGAFKSYLLFKK